MDKHTKIRLLDRMVDRYCTQYLRTTPKGVCDGKCPFKGLCSIEQIKKNYQKVEEIFEAMKRQKLEEMQRGEQSEDSSQRDSTEQ